MQIWDVDEDYIPTLQIKLLAGRNFSKGLATDSGAIILNEAAMKFLGRGNPIGKKLYRFTDDQAKTTASFQIIGVLKNFNFNSLREVVTPLMLKLGRNTGNISLRVETNNITGLLNQIENVYKAMAPGQPFSYSFMDDTFNRQYQSEQRTGKISVTFSVVAILIACLGLFGLVTYSASQRIREIGIRKVLGASVPGLINMLCQDLLLLVLWAACIAFPLSWWLMNKWLQDFAYRVAISWWIFAIAGAAALLIALVTVASQAVKAALMNPVTSLRSE